MAHANKMKRAAFEKPPSLQGVVVEGKEGGREEGGGGGLGCVIPSPNLDRRV